MVLKLKKQVKKKFIPIVLPLINEEVELYATEIGELNGRFIKFDISNKLKGKSMEIRFLVSVEGNKAEGKALSIQLFGHQIRRSVRKGTDYVEDSFLVQCKDHRIRIKPFLVARKKVPKKVRKAIREKAKEELIAYAKSKTFDGIVSDILNGKIQKDISHKIKKIYPLSVCEIKSALIEDLKEHEIYEQKRKDLAEKEEAEDKLKEENEAKEAEEKEKKKNAKGKTVKEDKKTEENKKEEYK